MPISTIADNSKNSKNTLKNSAVSASLGKNANNLSNNSQVVEISPKQKRANSRFKLLDTARDILTRHDVKSSRANNSHRTRHCLAHHAYQQEIFITLNEKSETSRAGITGVQTCGSICSCPVCAQRKMLEYGNNIKRALEYAERNNLRPVMVTLTAKHTRKMSLNYFKNRFRDAYNMFQRHRTFRDLKKSLDIQHTIVSREVTIGKNGWHYHMHILYFVPVSMIKHAHNSAENMRGMTALWIDCLENNGLQGIDRIALSATATNESKTYLAKFGFNSSPDGDLSYEMTGSENKDSRTVWDVLATARYGDIDAELKYVEYVKAMQNHKWITYSNGLLDACEYIELDVEEVPENQKLYRWLHVDPRDWYAVSALGMIANVINYSAKTRCKTKVRDFIRRLSDSWYYDPDTPKRSIKH